MSKFVPRKTAPTKDNHFYYKDNIFYKCGYGMPNCTAYAWGRLFELTGQYPKLSTANAENWFNKKDGYARGQTPKLGAVAVWAKGKIGVSSDGAGHVAAVEEIEADGTINTSNSAWKGTNFYMKRIKPPYQLAGYNFLGFIYPPVAFDEDKPEPTPTPTPTPEPAPEPVKQDFKIGDKVVVTGYATGDSFGGGSKTAKYTGSLDEPRYITKITDLSRPRPYHISVGSVFGNGDRGWVSKDQIKKIG